jgi:flagellar hook-basal body complex protein FliE
VIPPVGFGSALPGITKAAFGDSAGGGSVTGTGSGSSFGSILAQGLQSLQDVQTKQDTLAVKAATGDLTNVHDYTVAAAEAKLATSLTVALRDKAVGAFNEILRMQA